jgi:hypothetical protein
MTWDNLYMYGEILATIVGLASMTARILAPLTNTTLDNRLAGWLGRCASFLGRLGLHPRKT